MMAGFGGSLIIFFAFSLIKLGIRRKRLLIGAFLLIFTLVALSCSEKDEETEETTEQPISHTISGLDTSTTYYWKVVAKDSFYSTESEVWSFSTQ